MLKQQLQALKGSSTPTTTTTASTRDFPQPNDTYIDDPEEEPPEEYGDFDEPELDEPELDEESGEDYEDEEDLHPSKRYISTLLSLFFFLSSS